VLSRVTRIPFLAAGIGAITILAAGCAALGHTATSGSGAVTPQSAQQTIRLAAFNAQQVNSFSTTISGTVGVSGSTVQLAGTIQEQTNPSVEAEANFTTLSGAGLSLPGGASEIITSKAVYIKVSELSQALRTSKPWLEMPLSSLSTATGINFGSLLREAQANNPLTQTQMLTASPDVRKVGTGTVNGVPVTGYAGTFSIAKGLAELPAAARKSVASQLASAGLSTAHFTVWLDAQNQVRKITVSLTSSKLTETVSETITSVNQPVTITVPTSSETYVLPSSILGGKDGTAI